MVNRTFANKTVVFFDWNHTLVDAGRSFDAAFLHVLGDYAGRWDPADKNWSPEAVLSAYKREFRLQRRKPAATAEQAAVAGLKQALRGLPFPKDRAGLAAIHRQIRKEQQRRCAPLPGVLDVLKRLSQTHTLCVVTNSPHANPAKAGLSEWIPHDRCFNAAQAGHRKPHPGIFRYAMNKLKTPPSQCVMVGNSWLTDVRGAERARIDAVWLNKHARKPLSFRQSGSARVAVIRSLPVLLRLLQGG